MFVNWKPVFRENKPLTPRKSADFVTGKGIKREGRENGLSVRELAREQKREEEGKGRIVRPLKERGAIKRMGR